jgi:hypothetical protein
VSALGTDAPYDCGWKDLGDDDSRGNPSGAGKGESLGVDVMLLIDKAVSVLSHGVVAYINTFDKM